MEFCIITPIAGLERYATLSKTHLVLAQVKDPRYMTFHKNRGMVGDTLILDNGAYEGELDVDSYREAIDFYEPDVVVLPDKLNVSWEENLEIATSFLNKVDNDYNGVEWMFVPQTLDNDIYGWIEGLMHALNEMNPYTIEWVGLPRRMATHYFKSLGPDVRAKACKFIKNYASNIKVHALGMADGNVEEIGWLKAAGCSSIDSSCPVWRAWTKGLNIQHPDCQAIWREAGTPVDFNSPIPESEFWKHRDLQILDNLEAVNVNTSSRR